MFDRHASWRSVRRALALCAPMLVAFGAPFDANVSAADAPAEVVVVGDSITADNVVQLRDHLTQEGLPPVHFEALAARRIDGSYEWHGWRSSGLDAIAAVHAAGIDPDLWVIELGTNDMFLVDGQTPAEMVAVAGDLIDKVVDAVGTDERIAWVTVLNRDNPDTSRAFNKALRERAATHGAMRLLDWNGTAAAHPEWFLDLVHPNAAGAAELARLYAEAIERRFEPPPIPVRAPVGASDGASGGGRLLAR